MKENTKLFLISFFFLFFSIDEILVPIVENPWQGGPPTTISGLSPSKIFLFNFERSL